MAKNGTSVLKNHIKRCKLFPANLNKKQKLIDFDCDDKIGKCVPSLWVLIMNLLGKQ